MFSSPSLPLYMKHWWYHNQMKILKYLWIRYFVYKWPITEFYLVVLCVNHEIYYFQCLAKREHFAYPNLKSLKQQQKGKTGQKGESHTFLGLLLCYLRRGATFSEYPGLAHFVSDTGFLHKHQSAHFGNHSTR